MPASQIGSGAMARGAVCAAGAGCCCPRDDGAKSASDSASAAVKRRGGQERSRRWVIVAMVYPPRPLGSTHARTPLPATDRTLDIHVIAIGGTGMAPFACLMQDLGHRVRGADGPLYPPMSTLLERAGITPLY